MKYLISSTLILLVLSACSVSKNLETPKPELPDSFRTSGDRNDTTSIGDVQWKSFFTDATLQKLIDSAIVKNYDMQIAIKNIEAAELTLRQVKWNYVPDVNLNVTASSNRPSDNSLTGLTLSQNNIASSHIEDYSANVGLSWEADIWGKIRNQQKGSLALYLQTAEAKKAIQTSIVAQVASGFYNLLMLDEQLETAQKNVRLNDSTLNIIKLQFEAGQLTSLAVQQAEAQQLAAAQLVPFFEQNITVQENALRILSGELPDKVTRSGRLQDIIIPEHTSAGLPASILSRRPDVRTAELLVTVANANVGISKANMYPALRITATGGINSFKSSDWFNIPSSLFGIVAGGIAQPLLNSRELKTRYEIARIDREKAILKFRQSVLGAVGEVSNALVTIEKLKSQEEVAAERVRTLQKATGNANQLFRNGMATYLEVITAQGNVLQSELTLSSIKRNELAAVAELYRSLGGGWK